MSFEILVFGGSGCGKTSLIYALAPNGTFPAGSSLSPAVVRDPPCFSKKHAEFQRKSDGRSFQFTEVVGLSGKPSEESKKYLEQFLCPNSQSSKPSFHLAIMVCRNKLDHSAEENCNIFYKYILKSSIPLLVVVTGCERVNPVSSWAKNPSNLDAVRAFGISYDAIVSTSFYPSETLAEQRIASSAEVWSNIDNLLKIGPHFERDPSSSTTTIPHPYCIDVDSVATWNKIIGPNQDLVPHGKWILLLMIQMVASQVQSFYGYSRRTLSHFCAQPSTKRYAFAILAGTLFLGSTGLLLYFVLRKGVKPSTSTTNVQPNV